ncbi:MAG TPA: hypothetical protein VMM55_03865, partial [Thermohalobaculum sp.]|nr:hypothetical protein [Thermohalobaculum sp.]
CLESARRQGATRRGEGPINLIVAVPENDREVEIALPGRYAVDPGTQGALKAANGVALVEKF